MVATLRAFLYLKGGHEMSLLSQKFKFLRKKDVSQSGHQITEQGGREWENFYRDRWSYDKV